MAAFCGIVFGICAVLTVMAFVPNILDSLKKKRKNRRRYSYHRLRIRIRQRNGYTTAESVQPEEEEDADSADHLKMTAPILDYKTIWDIAEEPRKALVR